MGDGVNIAARLEGIAKPGGIYVSEDAYRQVRARLHPVVTDLGPMRFRAEGGCSHVWHPNLEWAEALPAQTFAMFPCRSKKAHAGGYFPAAANVGRCR